MVWWDPLQLLGQVSGGLRVLCERRARVKITFEKLRLREKGSMCAFKLELLLSNSTDTIIWGGERHAIREKREGPSMEFTLGIGTLCWQEFNYSFPASQIPNVRLTKLQPFCVTIRGSSLNPLA